MKRTFLLLLATAFCTLASAQVVDQGRDLVKEMTDRGYTFVDNLEDLNKVKEGRVLGLFAPLEMEPALDRGPVLEDCAMKAIELLDNRKEITTG